MIAVIKDNSQKLLVLACFLMLTIMSCRFYFHTTKDNFKFDDIDNALEHGKKLTYTICGDYHYNTAIKKFSGIVLNDFPKIAGRLYSANLTRSASNGIPPRYTDAELFYLLKTGIAKNGKFMPYMMKQMMISMILLFISAVMMKRYSLLIVQQDILVSIV
jgi:hypothetical protein